MFPVYLHYIKKVDEQVKEKIFIINKKRQVGMANVYGSKMFSNKRVNFSQVTSYHELTIPTSLPSYLILAYHGSEVARGKRLLD